MEFLIKHQRYCRHLKGLEIFENGPETIKKLHELSRSTELS